MIHKEFWGLLFLAFVGWIFMTSNPQERIDRVCKPVDWSGNVITSLSALAVPAQQNNVQMWFTRFDYSCQYMVWRLFYQADYTKAVEAAKQQAATATAGDAQPGTATAAPASRSATASGQSAPPTQPPQPVPAPTQSPTK